VVQLARSGRAEVHGMTSTSKVRLITTYSQFELAMADSSGVVVVLYTAPGCPHCNNFLPKFNELSVERGASNVAFYNVNLMSGDGMAIARKNNVRPARGPHPRGPHPRTPHPRAPRPAPRASGACAAASCAAARAPARGMRAPMLTVWAGGRATGR